MAKEFARSFYGSQAWKDCREAYAKSVHYLCENCLRKGIYKPGVIVHHKIELTPINIKIPEIATGFDNLEMLCRECHQEEHKEVMDEVAKKWGNRFAEANKRRKEQAEAKKRFKILEDGTVIGKKVPPYEN